MWIYVVVLCSTLLLSNAEKIILDDPEVEEFL
jgi:hypothetical protein